MTDKNKIDKATDDLNLQDYDMIDVFGQSLPNEPLLSTVVATIPELRILHDLLTHYASEDVIPQEYRDSYAILLKKLSIAMHVPTPTIYTNVYQVARQYGGPEEGGWYFTSRECVHSMAYTNGDELLEDIHEVIEAYFDQPEDFINFDIYGLWYSSSANPSTREVVIVEHPLYHEHYEIRIETGPAISTTHVRPHYE